MLHSLSLQLRHPSGAAHLWHRAYVSCWVASAMWQLVVVALDSEHFGATYAL
jgi:hypothetical protein